MTYTYYYGGFNNRRFPEDVRQKRSSGESRSAVLGGSHTFEMRDIVAQEIGT